MAAPAVREDHVQLFHLYVLFGGNCARVAAVSRVDADRIEALAHDNLWKLKANGRQRLDTDEGKETEREINRVATYVTADRLSKVFENIVSDLDGDPEFARAFCTETDVDGEKSFNTKNLKDLANGLQVLADIKPLGIGEDRLNVGGGGIALGHPIGASGARVLVSLIHHLHRTGGKRGVCSLCLGGGNAVSMLVEAC